MRFILKILFLYLLSINVNAIELSKNLMMDMSRTYGYYLGQTYVLDSIEKKYPYLKNDVFSAKNEFDLKFSTSLKEIEQKFSKNMTVKQWHEYKLSIKNKIQEQVSNNNITHQDSFNFIQEVKSRATGNIESPVIETLLMFNPNYQKNPISELGDNFYQKYNSKNNPKVKAVDFNIRIPKSWKSTEGNRPNIVRKFISNNGYIVEDKFMENIIFGVYDLPIEVNSLTQQDLNDICNDIPANSILRDCKKTNLENLPVVTQRIKMDVSRLENNVNMEIIQYNIFYKNKLLMIQGQVGTINDKVSEKTLLERFEKFKPVFSYVANSLVINDLYLK